MHFSTFQEVLTFLYENLPMFQRQGASAFRKDLIKTIKLDEITNHPHKSYKIIHIAGTNGKGSTAHMLSAVLQSSGYKTGLYTSPHLRDFTERIKIDGKQMSQDAVVDFINKYYTAIEEIKPSFFEITAAMAFEYFKKENVDIAVIETGMGGRLDSTNIVSPILSLITNVSYDHMQFLGDTLPEIAMEKAGIIKNDVPVVISERQPEVAEVFEKSAKMKEANIYFATDDFAIAKSEEVFIIKEGGETWEQKVRLPLQGEYQKYNIAGVLKAMKVLIEGEFIRTDKKTIIEGLEQVIKLTGLKGRYQTVRENPKVIADVGHNKAGLEVVFKQVMKEKFENLYIILGVVNDKDLSQLWHILPKKAYYFFTQAEIPRALDAVILGEEARRNGYNGTVMESIPAAYQEALAKANKNDLIFVGGSTFTVAEIKDIYNEE